MEKFANAKKVGQINTKFAKNKRRKIFFLKGFFDDGTSIECLTCNSFC